MNTVVIEQHRPVQLGVRMFRAEFVDEIRAIVREPASLFFSIVMPTALFALFVALFGKQGDTGTQMIASFGTFGVLAVTLLNPGIGVAADRERGWLRAKQVSGVPVGITIAAKVASALPYALAVLTAMAVIAGLTGSLHTPVGGLFALAGVLLLGALPFALLGLAVGFQAGTNATSAILNAFMMPASILAGLWIPLNIMPAFIQHLAPFLPTYHLAGLAKAQLYGGPVLVHLLVLVGMTAVTAVLAAVSYRHSKS